MEAMQTNNLRITLTMHVLAYPAPKHVRHTAVPLGYCIPQIRSELYEIPHRLRTFT